MSQAKQRITESRDDLLRTYSFVPEEKLTWSPSSTSRSATWLVAHCGLAGQAFAAFLRGERPPMPDDPAELAQQVWNAGREVTSREEAVRLVEESVQALNSALDEMTPERMATVMDLPFGTVPVAFWIEVAATHMSDHARQIDYLQTIWGDLEDHR